MRAVWRLGNAYLAAQAPWAAFEREPERAAVVARTGVNLVRAAALAAWPFIPTAAAAILENLGEASDLAPWPNDGEAALATILGGRPITVPPLLFRKIAVADVPHP